jgi:hypothetical protein
MTVTVPRTAPTTTMPSVVIDGHSFASHDEFLAWHERTARLAKTLHTRPYSVPHLSRSHVVLRPRGKALEGDYIPRRTVVAHPYAERPVQPPEASEPAPPPIAVVEIVQDPAPQESGNGLGILFGLLGLAAAGLAGYKVAEAMSNNHAPPNDGKRYLTAEDLPGYPHVWDESWYDPANELRGDFEL